MLAVCTVCVCLYVQLYAVRTLPHSETENAEKLDSYKQARRHFRDSAPHTRAHMHTDIRGSTESLVECEAEKNTLTETSN